MGCAVSLNVFLKLSNIATMNTIKKTTFATLAGAVSLAAFEGSYDYENLLKNAGTFYKDSSNPYIQKAKVYGRVQYQGGTVLTDGDSFDFVELRRTRLGLEVQFLEHFKWKGNADLENGGINDVEFDDFTGWDDASLTADLVGLFDIQGFDKLSLSVGKKKIKIGSDVHTSSTKIKAVERTRWTDNGLRPDNSTGVLISGETSGVEFSAGVFANADDGDFNFWRNGDSSFAYGSVEFGLGEGTVLVDGLFTFGDEDQSDLATANDYAWSIAYLTEIKGWATEFNIGGAEDFNGDNLFGASILVHKEVYENFELVGRLSYATGDHFSQDGSRYAREDDVVGDDLELSSLAQVGFSLRYFVYLSRIISSLFLLLKQGCKREPTQ